MSLKNEFGFIAVEGNIGAGKTTLAKSLSTFLNSRLMLEEFEHNSFLPLFYEDPDRYAFPLEMSFLADRYEQHSKVFKNESLFQQQTISDYIFQKSVLFGKNNLSEQEFKLYNKFCETLQKSIPLPDLVIYLHGSVDYLKDNIIKRGRSFENNISTQYLKQIEDLYFSFMKRNRSLRFLVVDREHFKMDFNDSLDIQKLYKNATQIDLEYGLNIFK